MKLYPFLSTALLLSVLTTSCGKVEESAQASSSPPTPVQLQTLQTSTLQDSTEFVGTLEAQQTVELKPQIDGQIQQILVKPGDRVKQGDPIFILNPAATVPQFESAQAAVTAALYARDNAAQQLRAAEAQLASARSQYDLARVNNTRYQYLANQGAIEQLTADQSATNQSVQADAVRSAEEQVAGARAALNQSDANVRQAQANAAAAEVSVGLKQVTAPISGFMGDITLKTGDYVQTGDLLTTINQNDVFDLQIPIPVSRSKELRQGLTVQLLDPTSEEQLGFGRLYFISSQVDGDAQSILTKARFSNLNGRLRDAQYVKARVIWDTQPGVLVPTEAVTTIAGQNFVFVAQERTIEGKSQTVAHQVPVVLGDIQGANYQVTKGLNPGDQIIVSGVLKLRDGAPIVPQGNTPNPS